MPQMAMKHDVDPRQDLLKQIGDLKDIELFNNQVLCAIYVRPEKTLGGIIIPEQNRAEDKIQGKVGLVVRKGPTAFVDDTDKWFSDIDVKLNDWVVFRASDGWSITVNKVLCRIVDDTDVRGRVAHPDQVW
jgi:co-chaperonin GroES (HSP10)